MSSRPTQSILFLIVFVFLVACQPAPPPVLPNMLVEVTGEAQVLRKGRSEWVPITLGAELQPGDTLLVSGEAAVFCGNETQWEASPKLVPDNKNYTVTCSEGRTLKGIIMYLPQKRASLSCAIQKERTLSQFPTPSARAVVLS